MEAVLQWEAHAAALCSGCGHPVVESMHPDLEGAFEVNAVACHACAAREAKAGDFKDAHGVKLAVAMTAEARAYLDELNKEA